MILSILICTIDSRKDKFNNLFDFIWKQSVVSETTSRFVEVLFESDNKEISVGAKRQKLLERAQGEFIVFVDDDDFISERYVSSILEATRSKPDCIGFLIKCNMEGVEKTAITSNRYERWMDGQDGFDFNRTIYHKSPVRRSIALQIGFKDLRYAEDADYSKRLKESGLLIHEEFIDEVLYHYNYNYEDANIKYGFNKDR